MAQSHILLFEFEPGIYRKKNALLKANSGPGAGEAASSVIIAAIQAIALAFPTLVLLGVLSLGFLGTWVLFCSDLIWVFKASFIVRVFVEYFCSRWIYSSCIVKSEPPWHLSLSELQHVHLIPSTSPGLTGASLYDSS